MNSLVSDTKVICNDSIPNPIAPIPIPITVPMDKESKSITILNGTHIKNDKGHSSKDVDGQKIDVGQKEEISMNTDTSNDISNESSLSPSEPMDCNSTPNISPAHAGKLSSSNEDVAMSETLVSFLFEGSRNTQINLWLYFCRLLVVVCRWKQIMIVEIRCLWKI